MMYAEEYFLYGGCTIDPPLRFVYDYVYERESGSSRHIPLSSALVCASIAQHLLQGFLFEQVRKVFVSLQSL